MQKNDRLIIYMNETYIHAAHIVPYCWSDNSFGGLKVPVSKGKEIDNRACWK